MSTFDDLPKDILWFIGMKLDCKSLVHFGQISQRLHRLFGLTGELVEILRVKLQEITRLNLTQYTKKQLGLLSQITYQDLMISAGGRHSLVASRDQVYSFGCNKRGQSGTGYFMSRNVSISIGSLEIGKIAAISAGGSHSLILNSDGRVFSFGNNESGQLGLGERKYQDVPTLIKDLEMEKITAISAGGSHSLFLNSQGQVFSCGNNSFGQLGLGDELKISVPILIETSEIGDIVAISAGGTHSLILNSQGQVFSFGCGGNGRLGLDSRKDRNTPTLIETTEIGKIEPPDSTRVVAISAGGEHSLILNSEGRVYSFGCHLSGQLGLGYVNNKSTPTLIEYLVAGDSLLSATNMIAISAGGDSSFMLNSEGQVFSFGYNDDGQLGLGHRGGRNIPTLIEYQVIGNVLLPTTKVIAISTGGRHSLILNSKRRIFSFGYNDDGQLGLGDETNTYSPNLISGLAI